MMKYIHAYALFLMSVFHTACGQSQTYPPPDMIRPATKDTVSSYGPARMVRNVKQARNGDMLIASYGPLNANGVGAWTLSRYDQRSLYDKDPAVTDIMSIEKMLCRLLEANDGSIWFGSLNGVYRYDGKTITDFKSAAGQK